ncbi:MAG TPA: threonine--tRNA ligase [Candidatus Saccharimonadales bacterium]|nr:threonine--tRNA ligase [Candidatus Saccharimonadales bacterium]
MDEPAKLDKNDHRRLGQELDLFVMSPLVGSGLPLFTTRGTILRDELASYANELRQKRGFAKVWTPHITKTDLYKQSGHWDKFGAELFLVKSQETKDEMVLKPMNCPHHIQIYASRPRSYRDLPVKFLETTTDYRDEKTGELQGLSRVRSITQDDSHAFCREDQIEAVINELISAAKEMYQTLRMNLKARLSFRDDSEGYLGSRQLWARAEGVIEKLAKSSEVEYFIGKGEAAFYGPKIDFMAEDVLGRTWQVATVQLDFVMPERFNLSYTDQGGQESRPVMIHCALLGSIERFLAVYIEHTGGRFPLWLAPEQLRIATLNDDASVKRMADELLKTAGQKGIRATLDDTNESVSKKIRDAETAKVPYMVVIGPKEVESGRLNPRHRSDLMDLAESSATDLLQKLSDDSKSRK